MDVRIKQKFIGGGQAGLRAIRFHDLRHNADSRIMPLMPRAA